MPARVSPASSQPNSRPASHRRRTDFSSLYEVGARYGAPTINLTDTPGSRLLSASNNEKLLQWMRAHYSLVSSVTRVCAGMIFLTWALPAHIGRIIAPVAMLGTLPIIILSPLVMSTELLSSLCRHHEFWFFIVTNASNWGIASVLFNDLRITGCVACFLLNVLTIMMDANFRTIVPAVRTGLAWIPAITCIVIVCVTKVVDIDPDRFNAVIPRNKIDFTLANSFINVNTTLVIFVIRQTYRRRRVFRTQFLHDRVIPCCTIRCDLVLRRMRPSDRGSVSRFNAFLGKSAGDPDDASLHRPSFNLAMRPPSIRARMGERSATVVQVMRVITPTLAFLDLRHALIPALMPPCRLALWKAVALYCLGFTGLLLGGLTMYLPADHLTDTSVFDDVLGISAMLKHTQVLIPTASFVCTTIFFTPFLASYQRDIFSALRRNFDFGFTSLQFLIGCGCLADMMHWDYRCLALLSWILWFHWILMWDALLPEIRDRFRFKKIYGTPVLVSIQLGLVWIIYSLFFSTYNALDDRTLVKVSWGSFELGIRTSTFLVGRLSTMLTWSLRLVWKAVMADEDDLIFIRGQLEYYTPLDFFPPIPERTQARESLLRRCFRWPGRFLNCSSRAIHPSQSTHDQTNSAHQAVRGASPTSFLIEAAAAPISTLTEKNSPLPPRSPSSFSSSLLSDDDMPTTIQGGKVATITLSGNSRTT